MPRLGGDEFAVLCCGDSSDAAEVALRIRQSLEEPFEIEGHIVEISVSIGVAFGADGLDEEVLGAADRALFEAKAGGRSTVRQAR